MSIFSIFSRSQTTKEVVFWKWFNANESRLYDFEKDQNRIFQELKSELTKVDQSLTFEFGPKENGVRDFVISADGKRSAFPQVIALAEKAPDLSRWRVIKFRPRRPAFAELQYEGVNRKLDQIKFTLVSDGGKAGITIFIDGYDSARRNAFLGIAFLYLDNCLGEYDVETKVGFVEVKAMTEPSKSEKIPLAEITKTFDRFVAAKNN